MSRAPSPSVPPSGRTGAASPPPPSGETVVGQELGQRVAALQLQMRSLRDTVERLDKDVGALRSRLELADARLGELEEEGTQGRASADPTRQVDPRIADLEAAVAAVRDDGARLRAEVDRRLEQVAGSEGKADTGGIEELARKLAQLEEGHRGELETLRAALADRDERLDSLGSDLTTRLEALEARPAGEQRAGEGRLAGEEAGARARAGAPHPDDELRQIKGIGPKFERALRAAGIRSYDQIAAWDDAAIDEIAARIGAKPDRIRRDGWVASARELAAARGG